MLTRKRPHSEYDSYGGYVVNAGAGDLQYAAVVCNVYSVTLKFANRLFLGHCIKITARLCVIFNRIT